MVIKYYNQQELSYTSRQRYAVFNFDNFAEEEQKSIKLGDGATTSIKTSKNNICNYVTIDDTRWFVTYYTYQNGGQVTLYLQRDVVGEFGIDDCYGKIERGITNNILRNKKELSLNQILKSRKKIIPESNTYGNFSVNTHDKEAWGIIYIKKPTDGSSSVNVNIPSFGITPSDLEPISVGKKALTIGDSFCTLKYTVAVRYRTGLFSQGIKLYDIYEEDRTFYNNGNFVLLYRNVEKIDDFASGEKTFYYSYGFDLNATPGQVNERLEESLSSFIEIISSSIINGGYFRTYNTSTYEDFSRYDNVVVRSDNNYYRYRVSKQSENETTNPYYSSSSLSEINSQISSLGSFTSNDYENDIIDFSKNNGIVKFIYEYGGSCYTTVVYQYVTRETISPEETGQFDIVVNQNLVDEPFCIFAVPLYDCNVNGNNTNYIISKENAFSVFNNVVQHLSGQSGYLVDAQIYPYCPLLEEEKNVIQGVPFFSIFSTSYETVCFVDAEPFTDVKKEYICREYSIVSPDKNRAI